MLKRIYILFIMVLPAYAGLFAQSSNKVVNAARKEYASLKYALVIKMLEPELQKHPGNVEGEEMIADSYRRIKNYNKAVYWYAELTKTQPLKPQWALCYAEVLANEKQYDESGKWYLKYLELVQKDDRATAFSKFYPNVDSLFADRNEWKIFYTNLNTAAAEYAPLYYKQGLIFSSSRKVYGIVKHVFDWDQTPFTDLYYVDNLSFIQPVNLDSLNTVFHQNFKPNGKRPYRGNNDYNSTTSNDTKVLGAYNIKLAKDTLGDYLAALITVNPVPGKVNTKYHEGAAALLPDGSLMFTRNNYNNGKYGQSSEGINKLKIYIAKAPGWETVVPFVYDNDQYSVADPAVNKAGTLLIFSSDMPGGKGGADLYYCQRASVNDEWSPPLNMGPVINTEGNEVFPTLYRDSILLFSSTGHPGLGGLDIFQVKLNGVTPVGTPVNLGSPINSSFDDYSMIRSDDGTKGFFSSNRRGNDDIYGFTYHPFRIALKGNIIDSLSSKPVLNGKVTVDPPIKVQADGQGGFTAVLNKETVYHITAHIEGYKTISGSVSSKNIRSDTTLLLTLRVHKKPPLYNCDSVKQVLTMPNVYYDLNKSNIRPDGAEILDRIVNVLKSNADFKLLIASYCDARGTDEYNIRLSMRRSKAAQAYLIAHGVSSSRIRIEYFGESNLVNNCTDGVPCTPEQQQLNRRSEFFISKDGKKVLTMDCDWLKNEFPK